MTADLHSLAIGPRTRSVRYTAAVDHPNANALIASIVLPFFYAAVYLDAALAWWQRRELYDWRDTVTSLGVANLNSALGVLSILIRLTIYTIVYEHYAFAAWPATAWWTWVIGLLLYDFTYYWQHRLGHRWNLLWASHVVHHSSERFNLSTALRVPSASMHLWTWLFALPLALAGIPPMVYAVAALLNLLYQFWIHTERIGRLGWFDRVFGSPSNHRVHHGVNTQYLDKNYGGILMLWDQLFGTFEEEREAVRYGTRAPVASWNPLWVNLHTLWGLLRNARALRWGDRLRLWLKHPGWTPERASPVPDFDLSAPRFAAPVDRTIGVYALAHHALLPALVVHLIALAPVLSIRDQLPYIAYQCMAVIAIGLLMGRNQRQRNAGAALEALRMVITLWLAAKLTWFGGLSLSSAAAGAIALVAIASLCALPKCRVATAHQIPASAR